ncbi:MAG: DUF429 domain-containing protein [Pseudomonadota bacterium]
MFDTRVHGVDGCKGGWAVVCINADGPLAPTVHFQHELGPLVAAGEVIAIDIPVGLPDTITGPGRAAEQAVRPLLGARQSSVFSMPSRRAIFAPDYGEACKVAAATSTPPRKVSKQAYEIFAKVREMDALMDAKTQASVFECHAEVAFWRLNGERPMPTAKRVKGVPLREGLAARIALLARHGYSVDFFNAPPRGVPLIDMVDAAAIALIARRCAAGTETPFPDPPDVDGRGLRVAIWA